MRVGHQKAEEVLILVVDELNLLGSTQRKRPSQQLAAVAGQLRQRRALTGSRGQSKGKTSGGRSSKQETRPSSFFFRAVACFERGRKGVQRASAASSEYKADRL
jgi:hypothetical protein